VLQKALHTVMNSVLQLFIMHA